MSYFEHTKRDLAEAKKEIADLFAALAADTARKMEDPETYDRTYLLEDLLARMTLLADADERNVSRGYPDLFTAAGGTRAYEITPDPEVHEDAEITQDLHRTHGDPAIGIRAAAMVQTWDGYPRHSYERGMYAPHGCDARIRDVYLNAGTVTCGRHAEHEIHNLNPKG